MDPSQAHADCPVHPLSAGASEIASLPLPPGDLGLPYLGETMQFGRDPHQFVAERRARYGPIFKTNLLGSNTVFLLDAGGNQWIFQGEGEYLENKWNGTTRRLLGGRSTAMLTGPEHARQRRLLLPHFHHSAMAAFTPTFQRIATAHFEQWADTREPVVLIPAMQKLVFELIVALLLGDDPGVDVPRLSALFRRWTAGLSAVPINLPFTTFGRALKANGKLRTEIATIVERRAALPEQPPDMLGSLLRIRDEQGDPLPLPQVIDEVHNELFAGHDTTVTVMTNLMIQLAQHPAAWGRALAELDGSRLPAALDLEQLKRLPFLNAVLNESMRAVTPVIGTFRVMLQDAAYRGYRIPKGWTVRLEIAGTHEDASVWTEPLAFDPDRWSEERAEQRRRPHSYIPFGGGPRICLGANFALAEMRVMLALLLRDYTWQLTPGQNLSYRHIPFPRPRSGGIVRFERRRA